MTWHFRYILVLLIAALIYEVYLVAYYEYEQYQTNAYVASLEKVNREIEERNIRKQEMTLYIRTSAYESFVAKATQNKKFPWEEVTNIVDQENMNATENLDVNTVISHARKQQESSSTKGMSNPEKWYYIIKNLRDFL